MMRSRPIDPRGALLWCLACPVAHVWIIRVVTAWHPQLEDLVCEVCGDGGDEELLIMCDGACGCGYHTYCLTPELEEVPDGDWFCTSCAKRLERAVVKKGKEKIEVRQHA